MTSKLIYILITIIIITEQIFGYICPEKYHTEPGIGYWSKLNQRCTEQCIFYNRSFIPVCRCDPDCARYGDCCRTSPYFKPEEQRLGASPFTCMAISGYEVYVIASCPPHWEDAGVRQRCEHPKYNHDPLLEAPVTSLISNTTYRNWYCATCNQLLKESEVVIWNAKFVCPIPFHSTLLTSTDGTSSSIDSISKHLTFNDSISRWVYTTQNNKGSSIPTNSNDFSSRDKDFFEDTIWELLYITPPKVIPRSCGVIIKDKCAATWSENQIRKRCEAYTERVCSVSAVYRNKHCMMCNYDKIDICHIDHRIDSPVKSFSVLLDWKRLKRNACNSSEIYDPLAGYCRKMYT